MSIIRPFRADDLFKFNNVNLDIWTETYGLGFYFNYLSRWPDMCCTAQHPSGRLMGYGTYRPKCRSQRKCGLTHLSVRSSRQSRGLPA
jgi:ribosomal protein S18 acetylase RimI-like enzyme